MKRVIIEGPPVTGKTSRASKMESPLFIAFNGGSPWLKGSKQICPANWNRVLEIVEQLKRKDVADTFKTIVIDDWHSVARVAQSPDWRDMIEDVLVEIESLGYDVVVIKERLLTPYFVEHLPNGDGTLEPILVNKVFSQESVIESMREYCQKNNISTDKEFCLYEGPFFGTYSFYGGEGCQFRIYSRRATEDEVIAYREQQRLKYAAEE